MIKKNVKVGVCITNPQYGSGKKAICIRINDENSHLCIADIELSYEDFVVALNHGTGYGVAEVNISENIGMRKESSSLQFDFNSNDYPYKDREKAAYEKAKILAPDGWIVSSYFGSKGQIPFGEGKCTARIYRFVEPKEEKE